MKSGLTSILVISARVFVVYSNLQFGKISQRLLECSSAGVPISEAIWALQSAPGVGHGLRAEYAIRLVGIPSGLRVGEVLAGESEPVDR